MLREASEFQGKGSARLLSAGVIMDLHAMSFATHLAGSCVSQLSRLAADLALGFGRLASRPVGSDVQECGML